MVESTLLIDIILWTVYVLLAVTVGMAVWSGVHGVRTHERMTDQLASRHTSLIGYATIALVAVVMLLTYLLGSSQPIATGGNTFADAFWLKLIDMFIYTSLLLICLCSVIVVAAKFRR
jgi:hypothetical protein